LVLKSVTLNDLERRRPLMAVTLRYFNEFGKPAFQLITASSSIELIDQKSASITHRAVKLVCVTKFTHSRVDTKLPANRFTLLTFNLLSKFHFTVARRCLPQCFDAWLPVDILLIALYNYAVSCSMGVQCTRHQF